MRSWRLVAPAEWKGYDGLSMGFASHKTINHTRKEYVRGDGLNAND